MNKRANESVGMSMGVIFSIFLIIVFISVAFVAIRFFLNMSNTSQIGNFYTNLQDEVNKAWSSSGTNRTFEISLPKKVEYICFMDFNSSSKGEWASFYRDFEGYIYNDVNLFIYPSSAVNDLKFRKIEHLDLGEITSLNNPYCIPNPSKLTIQKEVYSRLVNLK